jgi:MerR family transcriptional regulator, light-induced transcriptional regulator
MSDYNIQVASKLSGVGIHTLRAWEKRYKVVTPKRNDSGRRLYSQEDITKLQLLSELCTLGSSIGTIANKTIEDLRAILKKLGRNEFKQNGEEIAVIDTQEKSKESLNNLLLGLEYFKLDVISHEITKLKLSSSLKNLVFQVLSPLLSEVGMRVYRKEFSIAQEMALSSILKFHIGQIIYRAYETKSKNPHRIAIAAPESNFNEFGILLSSILCAHYGVNFFYLGANLPASALVDAAKSIEADIVLVYVTEFSAKTRKGFLEEYIFQLDKKLSKDKTIYLGGNLNLDLEQLKKTKRLKLFSSLKDLDLLLQELL